MVLHRESSSVAHRRVLIALICAAGFGVATAASADQAAGASQAGERLEEITVTAQRRSENLQDVPISVDVVSGQALAATNQNSLDDLTHTMPGVYVQQGGPSSDMFIRGIGSGGSEAFDQSVGMFIDDVYHGRSRTSIGTFLDLDRVEVLKGPQSTYFGNNAIAGAVNILTRKPGDHFEASIRALYGMYGAYALEGAAGGPITDTKRGLRRDI
jgi:iron complex outermembrane receptor protein